MVKVVDFAYLQLAMGIGFRLSRELITATVVAAAAENPFNEIKTLGFSRQEHRTETATKLTVKICLD